MDGAFGTFGEGWGGDLCTVSGRKNSKEENASKIVV